jgi:hypothetical protein
MPLPNPFALEYLPVRRGAPSEEAGASAPLPGKGAPVAKPGGLLGRFLQSLRSEETRRGYRQCLESFFEPHLRFGLAAEIPTGEVPTEEVATEEIPTEQVAIAEVTEKHVRKVTRGEILCFLINQRHSEGYSKNTIRRRATALRSFYRWLKARGHVEELPFGKEEGSTKLMKAALNAGGDDSGRERTGPTRLGGGARSHKTFPFQSKEAAGELLEIRPWIPQVIDSVAFAPPDWETFATPSGEKQFPISIQYDSLMFTLSLRQLPAAICWVLRIFCQISEQARQEGRVPKSKFLRVRGPQPLRDDRDGFVEARVRYSPYERISREGASRTSSGDGRISAVLEHPALQRIRDEGPAPRFAKWPVLRMLAALYGREWSLPDPLCRQLQHMVEDPIGREAPVGPEDPLDPSGQGGGRLPSLSFTHKYWRLPPWSRILQKRRFTHSSR